MLSLSHIRQFRWVALHFRIPHARTTCDCTAGNAHILPYKHNVRRSSHTYSFNDPKPLQNKKPMAKLDQPFVSFLRAPSTTHTQTKHPYGLFLFQKISIVTTMIISTWNKCFVCEKYVLPTMHGKLKIDVLYSPRTALRHNDAAAARSIVEKMPKCAK